MTRRLYVATDIFTADSVTAQGRQRTFKRGDQFWFDEDQSGEEVVFEIDGHQFNVKRSQFKATPKNPGSKKSN